MVQESRPRGVISIQNKTWCKRVGHVGLLVYRTRHGAERVGHVGLLVYRTRHGVRE